MYTTASFSTFLSNVYLFLSIHHSVQCVWPLPPTHGLGLSDVDASHRLLRVSILWNCRNLYAFNLSRYSCHTSSNYIINKNKELQIHQRILSKNLLGQNEPKTHNLSRMHLHIDKISSTRTSSKRICSSDSVQEWPPHRILSIRSCMDRLKMWEGRKS